MIVVIDYNAGNLYNVGNALKHIGVDFTFSQDPKLILRASQVILPGVGSARAAMDSLHEQGLVEVIKQIRVPFLGICLGLQLMFDASDEEDTPCLGILNGRIRCFDDSRTKVPHIGWNQVWRKNISPLGQRSKGLLDGIANGTYFYFVHSYYAPSGMGETVATTNYANSFTSIVVHDNFWGVQFHPERSGKPGLRLLKNFLGARISC